MPSPDEFILGGLLARDFSSKDVAVLLEKNFTAFLQAGGPDRLQEPWPRRIAELAVKYHAQTEDFLTLDELTAILQNKNTSAEDLTQAQFVFSRALDLPVPEGKFRFWLNQAKAQDAALDLAEVLGRGMKILDGKVADTDGVVFSGAGDTVAYLQSELARITASDTIATQPSGNIRAEKDSLLAEIDAAERGVAAAGRISTGFAFLDAATSGFDLSDFLLVGGYTGEGKSQFCHNVAWHCAMAGWNVQIVTAETARKKYRRRVLTRHSHKPGVGIIGGIPYNVIKNGAWESEEQRELYAAILADFCDNPSYGVIDVTQVSAGATLKDIRSHALNFQRAHKVPLQVLLVDYLALLSSPHKRRDRREEINDILKEFKELCLTFDNGAGLFGIAAHQMKQDRRELVKPESGKFYTVSDFSDTSEAGKSADVAVALLRTDELKKMHELAAGILKNRDGEVPSEVFRLFESYESAFLGNIARNV